MRLFASVSFSSKEPNRSPDSYSKLVSKIKVDFAAIFGVEFDSTYNGILGNNFWGYHRAKKKFSWSPFSHIVHPHSKF
jgi:hypothetical protein